ncbi:MAG: ATP-binding protein [Dehalococcoidales bacterium]|nr:ATP-binding protein [Dehalococcoidales bacterium]
MKPLRVLIVEDSEQDAALLIMELQKAGYSPVYKRVDTASEMSDALDTEAWDIIISDHSMPSFSSLDALRLSHEKGLDLPFIIVSGQIGEDTAVETMRAGAHDYIMKDNLKRLGPAIERELEESANRRKRRKAEEELRAREEELRLAKKIEALKDEFIGMVSHELKTPLTVIIGALKVAATDGVTIEEARDLIHNAAANAEALAAMVNNLLELSRYQSDRLNLQTMQTQVKPVIQAIVQKFQNISVVHHLTVDFPAELPAAMIDPIRIERVLHNLVENAIKYSPDGGEVRIFGSQRDTQLLIGVSDQGIGISPEDQTRLFQSFQRLDVQNKYDIAGVGLGLKVCHILVEAHGGHIWVESTPGKGSTFCLTLPISDDKQ